MAGSMGLRYVPELQILLLFVMYVGICTHWNIFPTLYKCIIKTLLFVRVFVSTMAEEAPKEVADAAEHAAVAAADAAAAAPAKNVHVIGGTEYEYLADGKYDVIICGTGTTECILSGLCAVKKLKVIQDLALILYWISRCSLRILLFKYPKSIFDGRFFTSTGTTSTVPKPPR